MRSILYLILSLKGYSMKHINSISQARELLNGRLTKKLEDNTLLVDSGKVINLVFHDQVIAQWSHCGFHVVKPDYFPNERLTCTTIKRLNTYCPTGMRVSSGNKGTYLHHNEMKFSVFN